MRKVGREGRERGERRGSREKGEGREKRERRRGGYSTRNELATV